MNLLMMYLPGDKIAAAPDILIEPDHEEAKSEWLLKLENAGINTDNGLNNCGAEEVYKKVVSRFISGIPLKTEELDRAYQEKDCERYEIEIHAVKSSARIIGADKLADLARDMEKACGDKDFSRVLENHETVLSMLSEISKLDERQTVEPTKGKIDEKNWSDAVMTIREFAQNMDKTNIEFVLDSLKQYELSEDMVQCTKEIERMVSRLEWEKLSSFGE